MNKKVLLLTLAIIIPVHQAFGFGKVASVLIDALNENDMGLFEAYIRAAVDHKKSVDSDPGDDPIYTVSPLMHAAKMGRLEAMKKLINAGANVNYRVGLDQPSVGQTVLSYAIDGGSVEAVKLLLSKGAKVNDLVAGGNVPGIRNNPILKYAITTNASRKIIDELIANGANVNHNQDEMFSKGIKTWTPLMLAAKKGLTETMVTLLLNGADLEAKNERDGNKTAHDYAQESGHGHQLQEALMTYKRVKLFGSK